MADLRPLQPSDTQVLVSGLVLALVGFSSSAAVVLAGLVTVGATASQAASGLLVLSATSGVGTLLLSRRHRLPVVLAWSTPGAALLASSTHVEGGWPAAVGAFVVTGLLILLTAAVPALGRVVAAIPAPIAQAMLAGVLLPLCLAPVRGAVDDPWRVIPLVVVWLLVLRLAPRWAVPASFLAALVVVVLTLVGNGGLDSAVLPALEVTAPTLTVGALFSVALPLYVVTMASQNVPGVAVLASYGFTAPWRSSMLVTGAGTVLGAPLGGHAVNLAAITAAMAASPQAHPDPAQRWRVAWSAGWTYLVLALASTALAGLLVSGPAVVIAAVAGVALLGTLAASLQGALADEQARTAAVVTFVVAASGTVFLGVGAAFWSLLVGLVVLGVTRDR